MGNMSRDLKSEIAERKRVEEKAQHLNALLRAIRNISQLVAREKDRDNLLQGACECLSEARGYHSTWIVFLDESRKLTAVAEAGLGEDFQLLVNRIKRGDLNYCAEKALSQTGAFVIEDPSSACGDCLLTKKCFGRKAIATRLEYGGEVFGLMVASIDIDRAIDKEEQSLFEEVAGDISFALHSIRLEEERRRAEGVLLLEQSRLEALLQLGQMAAAPLQEIMNFALEAAVRLTENKIGYLAFMNEDETVLTCIFGQKRPWNSVLLSTSRSSILWKQQGYGEKQYGSGSPSLLTIILPPVHRKRDIRRATSRWYVI